MWFRIKLTSTEYQALEEACKTIRELAEQTGIKLVGPIPLPTKRLIIPTRRTPCGEGSKTWDKWEMRIHRRLIIVDATERFMRRFMIIKMPPEVDIDIKQVRG